jgi:C1A family cysteine protease
MVVANRVATPLAGHGVERQQIMAQFALGWTRDLPDFRDFGTTDDKVIKAFAGSRTPGAASSDLPASVDLRRWCSPIENQGNIGSCTAHAGTAMLEYYERKGHGSHVEASRLFLYKVTRRLLGWTGDTGAYLRTTMKAMALFGVPPEDSFPYNTANYEQEPEAYHYALADNFESLVYYRHDAAGIAPEEVLRRVKAFLAAGRPSMFGFTVYNYGNDAGEFEFPGDRARSVGGHAVLAVGYDDSRRIGDHVGALRIRNSWGTSWGEAGYGWLPYEYVRRGLAVDFWSLTRAEYTKLDKF